MALRLLKGRQKTDAPEEANLLSEALKDVAFQAVRKSVFPNVPQILPTGTERKIAKEGIKTLSENIGVAKDPERSFLRTVVPETAKATLRGFEGILGGIGDMTRLIGEYIKELPAENETIPFGGHYENGKWVQEYKTVDAPDIIKNIFGKVGGKVAELGEVAGEFWRTESQKGVEAPDPKLFEGTFMENPSFTRAAGIVGEAIPSLTAATVMTIATKNPTVGAGFLGVLEGSGQGVEALKAGKDIETAAGVAVLSAVGTTLLEIVPLTRFMKGGSGRIVKDAFAGMALEGGEEVAQTLWQNIIAKYGYEETRKLSEGMVEALIGGAGSGGVMGGFTSGRAINMDNLIKEAKAKGVTDAEIEQMQEGLKNQIVANGGEIDRTIVSNMAKKLKETRGAVGIPGKAEDSLAKQVKNFETPDAFIAAQPKVFHGTGASFEQFDVAFGGAITEAKSAKGAIFFVDNPAIAKDYAVFAAETAPVKQALDKSAKLEKKARQLQQQGKTEKANELFGEADKFTVKAEELGEADATFERRKSATVKEVVLVGDFLEVDAQGKTPQELSSEGDIDSWLNKQIETAKKQGRDGVIFKNLDDTIGLQAPPATHYAVFSSKSIKTKSQLIDIYNKAKKARQVKAEPKTLTGAILARGGLDPDLLGQDYNLKELREFGLGHVFKKGGRGADEIAQELQSAGLLQIPENVNPGDHLIEMIKSKEGRKVSDTADATFEREYRAYLERTGAADLREDAGTEFDVERFEREAEVELTRIVNEQLKQAKKPSILKANDVKRVIREQTGQKKVSEIIEVKDRQALREQLRKESFVAREAAKETRGEERARAEAQVEELRIRLDDAVLKGKNRTEIARAKADFQFAQQELANQIFTGRTVEKAKRVGRERLATEKGKGKERIAKLKAQALESALRQRERLAARKLINKMINDIKGIDTSRMQPAFKAPVQEIMNNIDLAKPTKKTLGKLHGIVDELQRNPETDIPNSTLDTVKRLTKTSVRDMTVDQFKDVHDTLMHFVKLNSLKNAIITDRKRRHKENVIDDAIENFPARKEIDAINITDKDKTSARKFGDKLIETFGVREEHPDLVVETIADGVDKELYDVLFSNVNRGQQKGTKYVHESEDLYATGLERNDFARHNIKDINKWLRQKVKLQLAGGRTLTISRGKKLSILKHMDNDKNYDAILTGGMAFKDAPTQSFKLSPEDLRLIASQSDQAEFDFLAPSYALFNKQYEELNEVHVRTKGYELGKEHNYYPLKRAIAGNKILEEQSILEQFKEKFVRIGLWKGMLKDRQKSKLPVILDDVDVVVADSVFNAGAYIGLEEPLSMASKVLYDPRFRSELENRYGKPTWNYLDKYLRNMARQHDSYSSVEDILIRMKNPVTSAILGLNPFVMAKQLASYTLFGVYVDPVSLGKGVANYRFQRSKTIARHMKYSPLYRERNKIGYARDVADVLKRGAERRFTGDRLTVQQKLLSGIRMFDMETVGTGMEGAVIQKLNQLRDNLEMTPEQKLVAAYAHADRVVSITQPMFETQFRSDISRGTATEKLLTWFSTQLNQNLNLMRRTWRNARRTGDWGEFARAMILVTLVNSSAIYMIDKLRDMFFQRTKDRSGMSMDEKLNDLFNEWLLDVVVNNAGMLYFVRDIAQSFRSKMKRGTFYGRDLNNPIGSVLDTMVDTMVSGAEIFSEPRSKKKLSAAEKLARRRKSAKRFVEGSKQLIATFYGIPYYTPRKVLRRIFGLEKKQRKKKSGLRLLK